MTSEAKLISLLRAGGPAQGWETWFEQAVAQGIGGLRRLVFNTVVPADVRHGTAEKPPFEAVAEAWFASDGEAEALAAYVRDAGDAVQMHVDQRLIHDSGVRPLPTKIMVTLKGRKGATRAQTQHHWHTRHVEVGLIEHNAADFLRLYFQNHVTRTDQSPGSAHDYDGVPEYWLDQADLAEIGADSPVMRAIAEDEALFADADSIVTMMVTEKELFHESAGGWPVSPSPLGEWMELG